jgi:putative membrane protein
MRRRFPDTVYRHGAEPDARFTLANERTFLAWVRTALALIAGGVALEALGLGLHPGLRFVTALLLILAGTVTALHAWIGWIRSERALRLNTPLPSAMVALPVVVVVVIVGVLVALGILFA